MTGLGESVLAEDAYSHSHRRLRGMLQVNAQIQAGDSGGPLVDADGRVIGMDTAAGDGRGFVIPINTVVGGAQRHGWLDPDPSGSGSPSPSPDRGDGGLRARLALSPTLDLG